MNTAIIGAGLAGLSCAQQLIAAGHKVELFDKGRGPGGRMSTRRMETPLGEIRWDHGAQFFTARNERFLKAVSNWQEKGVVEEWIGTFLELGSGSSPTATEPDRRYVGTPGMNEIIRHLASDLPVHWGQRVTGFRGAPGQWTVLFEDGAESGTYERIVIAVPCEQAVDLLRGHAPLLAEHAGSVASAPCWAVLLAYDTPLEAGFDGARISGAPLSWIARNSSKPGRGTGEAWVLHASPDWSRENIDEQKEEVAAKLIRNFRAMSGAPEPVFSAAHRWLYAMVETSIQAQNFGWDEATQIGTCGDWCIAPRVEAAWQSGALLADHISNL